MNSQSSMLLETMRPLALRGGDVSQSKYCLVKKSFSKLQKVLPMVLLCSFWSDVGLSASFKTAHKQVAYDDAPVTLIKMLCGCRLFIL